MISVSESTSIHHTPHLKPRDHGATNQCTVVDRKAVNHSKAYILRNERNGKMPPLPNLWSSKLLKRFILLGPVKRVELGGHQCEWAAGLLHKLARFLLPTLWVSRSRRGRLGWRLHQSRRLFLNMKEKEVSVCSTGRRPGKRARTCRHISSSGGPSGPSTFVEELIEPVLPQLSLRQIAELNRDSNLWAAMLQTSSFKRLCAAAHPEMGYRGFGLVGWHYDDKDVMRVTLFDTKSNKWTHIDLTGFPEEKEYEDAMCASDGGLVCFVPIDSRSEKKMAAAALPILVCNPLTSDWKSLPLSPIAGRRQIILVQLVMDEDTKCYRVILVYADKLGAARGAFFYDSRTSLWSKQNAGLVYGAGNTLYNGQQDPHVFDCAHKVLHNLNLGTALGLPGSRMYSVVKDHLFVLDYRRESDGTSNGGTFNGGTSGTFELIECDWETNVVHNMRKLQTYSGTVNFALGDDEDQEHHAVLLPCSDFILLAWDINDDLNVDMSDQVFKLYDESAHRWYDIPTLDFGESRIRLLELDGSLMCDLRWDVIP